MSQLSDENIFHRCVQLASLGIGKTYPNPVVGAIIMLDGRIIGEGFHRKYGEAHAEVNAIEQVNQLYGDKSDEMLSKSTIFVSLEPCSHQGKTPPCADLLVEKKFKKVKIGSIDPFDKVNGRGIKKLQESGIEVEMADGYIADLCSELNKRFFTYHNKQRPYIILKWAESKEGFIAPKNERKQLSCKESSQLVHQWRSEEQAILIGTNTAKTDNPKLTVRGIDGKNPLRLVLDRNLEIPSNSNLYSNEAKTIIFNELKDSITDNIQMVKTDFDKYLLQHVLYQLYLREIQSVIVEGGAILLSQFIRLGLWDEARVFKTITPLNSGVPAPALSVRPAQTTKSGVDSLLYFRNNPTI
jgi:diaminohydroxyphosphoribosylaminopyrimidine deaminase/5-amino-6-(5-phosphoribosylamino)uracil reductase